MVDRPRDDSDADAVPLQPNPLQRLIVERKGEMRWSYQQIATRAGERVTRSRVQQLATRPMKDLPDRMTLQALADGLQLSPRTVLRAVLETAGYVEDDVEGLDTGTRVLLGRIEKMPAPQRATFLRIAEQMADLVDEAATPVAEEVQADDLQERRARRTPRQRPKGAAARLNPPGTPPPGEQEVVDP